MWRWFGFTAPTRNIINKNELSKSSVDPPPCNINEKNNSNGQQIKGRWTQSEIKFHHNYAQERSKGQEYQLWISL
jgi:hypothetical protein